MIILTRIKEFVKEHQEDIILVIGVILISLLSFAMGFIAAKTYDKEPLKFQESSNNWSGHQRALSCLETFGEKA
ncbi:MAG: hypothetical protein Q8M00_00145 [bacterium]|nr:hypothetical protein [bacterium]